MATVWACWWVFFAVASSLGERGGGGAALSPCLIAIVVFLGSAAIAWRRDLIGGGLLVVEGCVVIGAYAVGYLHANSVATVLFVLLTMALPPLLAGALLLRIGWRGRPVGTS